MKYSVEREIELPRDKEIALFEDRDALFEWQEGLQSFDHVSGEPGQSRGSFETSVQNGQTRDRDDRNH